MREIGEVIKLLITGLSRLIPPGINKIKYFFYLNLSWIIPVLAYSFLKPLSYTICKNYVPFCATVSLILSYTFISKSLIPKAKRKEFPTAKRITLALFFFVSTCILQTVIITPLVGLANSIKGENSYVKYISACENCDSTSYFVVKPWLLANEWKKLVKANKESLIELKESNKSLDSLKEEVAKHQNCFDSCDIKDIVKLGNENYNDSCYILDEIVTIESIEYRLIVKGLDMKRWACKFQSVSFSSSMFAWAGPPGKVYGVSFTLVSGSNEGNENNTFKYQFSLSGLRSDILITLDTASKKITNLQIDSVSINPNHIKICAN